MSSKSAILSELALSRTALKQSVGAVQQELDYPTKIRNSVRSKPLLWLGSAAAIGYILAGPKTRVKTVYKKGKKAAVSGPAPGPAKAEKAEKEEKAVREFGVFGLLATVVRIVFPMVRPALQSFLVKQATDWLAKASK